MTTDMIPDNWPWPIIGQECLVRTDAMHIKLGRVLDFEIFADRLHSINVQFYDGNGAAYAAHNVKLIDPRNYHAAKESKS